MTKLYELLDFPISDTGNGSLLMVQAPEGGMGSLPFPIRKVLISQGMKKFDVRGNHAHHETNEVLIVLKGGCRILLDDGIQQEILKVCAGTKGLLLYSHVWRVLDEFEEGTIILLLADRLYNEADYIRNKSEFLEYAKAGKLGSKIRL